MNAKIETKWSDEPWTEQTAVFIEKGSDRVLLGPLSIPTPRDCRVLFEPNYQRAMACVNACAGMESPSKEIERLKALNAEMLEVLQEARAWYSKNHRLVLTDRKPVWFSEALSLIQKNTQP